MVFVYLLLVFAWTPKVYNHGFERSMQIYSDSDAGDSQAEDINDNDSNNSSESTETTVTTSDDMQYWAHVLIYTQW